MDVFGFRGPLGHPATPKAGGTSHVSTSYLRSDREASRKKIHQGAIFSLMDARQGGGCSIISGNHMQPLRDDVNLLNRESLA